MEIRKVKVSDLRPAEYNPRQDLKPGDREYEKLHGNILRFGMVLPIVWNERTNTVVGGHQRLTVLENDGVEEVEVSVVNLDEKQEKQLNIALNKTGGNWDEAKLTALLDELGDDALETGFSEMEIEALQNDIDDLVDGGFLNDELSTLEKLFNLSLTFNSADRADINAYIKDYGKEDLVKVIIQKVRGEI